jgi:hypothetical protein
MGGWDNLGKIAPMNFKRDIFETLRLQLLKGTTPKFKRDH